MEKTKSCEKNVKRNKPTYSQHVKSDEKIPDAKNKLREMSNQARLIKLLERPGGATIDEMTKAIGWQQHSIRGMLSGVLKKRLGLSIASEKEERGRIYRITSI